MNLVNELAPPLPGAHLMRRRLVALVIAVTSLVALAPAAGASGDLLSPDLGDNHVCVRSKVIWGEDGQFCVRW